MCFFYFYRRLGLSGEDISEFLKSPFGYKNYKKKRQQKHPHIDKIKTGQGIKLKEQNKQKAEQNCQKLMYWKEEKSLELKTDRLGNPPADTRKPRDKN